MDAICTPPTNPRSTHVTRKPSLALPTLLCALVLPICALFIRPRVETGIIDDWSYTRSAQILSLTGHIAYNGWATAMLGWQLYFGAALIKIFGFSFTVTRLGTLLLAMAVAALVQRTLVRMGLTTWNSVAATLVFVLSPVFLPLSLSFMSDMYGLAALIGCCYCCVRALQAENEHRATAWVCAAAVVNALGGTARQIAWLGVLVMVPSTLWLLRRSRLVVWLGGLSTIAGVAFIAGALHWYGRQAYVIVEPVLPKLSYSPRFLLIHMFPLFFRITLSEFLLLILPLSLLFTPAIFRSRRTTLLASLVAGLGCLSAVFLLETHRSRALLRLCVPYMVSFIWQVGLGGYVEEGPTLLTPGVRILLTALLLLGGLGIACALLNRKSLEKARGASSLPHPSSREVAILLLPCCLAYMLLLVPRHLTGGIVDRYLLFPQFSLLVFVVLLYQRQFGSALHPTVWGLIAVMGALDVAGLHDDFAVLHAQVALQRELTASGVSRTAIDSGFEYAGWTELQVSGHINDPRIINPANTYHAVAGEQDGCHTSPPGPTPSVQARYVLSASPTACGGSSQFAPVTYHTYFAPHTRTLYVVLGPYANVR